MEKSGWKRGWDLWRNTSRGLEWFYFFGKFCDKKQQLVARKIEVQGKFTLKIKIFRGCNHQESLLRTLQAQGKEFQQKRENYFSKTEYLGANWGTGSLERKCGILMDKFLVVVSPHMG